LIRKSGSLNLRAAGDKRKEKSMKNWLKFLSVFLIGVAFLFFSVNHVGAEGGKDWPKIVTIGGAPVGGTGSVYAGGVAGILHGKLGINASVEATGGPVHNTQLAQSKEVTICGVSAPAIYEGWHGAGWAKGKLHQDIRSLFPMYNTYFQIYALKKTGIQSIYDLNGKRVGVGPTGGTSALLWPKFLEILGIKAGRIVNANSSDLGDQVKDGLIHANAQSAGIPWAAMTEAETMNELSILGVSKKDMEKVIEKYPYLSPGLIPKGTYKANKAADIDTLTFWSFYIAHKDLPDDFAYAIVKAVFENVDALIATHKAAAETRPEFIVYSPIPLHPGAVKYYKEKGIKLPDRILPPK
jgi:TRAP transporter TAXI family solute receptor